MPSNAYDFTILRGKEYQKHPKDSQLASDFQKTIDCLKQFRFTDTEIDAIFDTLVGLLYLGNLTIEDSNTAEEVNVGPLNTLTKAARYLGLGSGYLKYTLLVKVIKYPGHTIDVNNEVREARNIKTTMMKTIYSRLFDTINTKINATL